MADEEYDKKFNEMQKYLPFLQKIIEKLKINNNNDPDNPRKAQLQKMEMLHGLLTSKGKKLKMETLLKCEGVLIKLHTKMEKSNAPNPTVTANNSTASNANKSKPKLNVNIVPIEIVDITGPSSPPASPQAMVPARPIEIPTERRSPLTIIESTEKPTKSPFEDSKKTHHDNKHHHHHRHHHHQHKDRSEYSNKSRYETSKKQHGNRDTTFESSTSSKSTASSHLSEQRDTNLQQFRNPDRTIDRDRENYSWQRKNDDYSHLKHKTDNNNQPKPPIHETPEQISSDSAYSPEESWDEITKAESRLQKPKNISETVSSIDVVDLDSPPPPSPPATYDNIIFKYKKRDDDIESPNQDKTIFSRLGGKIGDGSSKFENFSINVINDRMKAKAKKDHSIRTPAKTIPPLCTKLPQPPLADVLKSPPLTANDISQLLDETVESSLSADSYTTSISSIGTRRPAKTETPSSTTLTSSLDMVRKKFAMITKSSPQFSNSISTNGSPQLNDAMTAKNSPQFNDSPASPTANSYNNPCSAKPNSTQNERLALKYHPHPRVERDSLNSRTTATTIKPTVAPAPFNVLPAINHFDPRLKKSLTGQPIPSLLSIPIASPSSAAVSTRNDTRFNNSSTPRSTPSFLTGKDHYNKINLHPLHKPTPTHQSFKNTSSQFQNNSPEECWDTDPEDSSAAEPVKTSTPNIVKADHRNQTVATPGRQAFYNETQSVMLPQTKNPQKGGYSSEENWDSDPETPITVPQTKSASQPSSAPQANSTAQPTSAPVAKIITLMKSDPRLQHSKTSLPSTFTDRHANTSEIKSSTEEYWNSKSKSIAPSPHVPSLNQGSNYQHSSNSTRFSALLNDKTERQKYFESKKQKHMEPRTYVEFRQAKARAAAEKAARKANEEGPKENITSVAQHNQTPHQSKESKETISNVTQNELEKTFTTKPLPASNLDKLYRSANFTSELPKSITKFKIPKKHNLAEEKDSEKKDEIRSKDNKLGAQNNAKGLPKNSEMKDNDSSKKDEIVSKDIKSNAQSNVKGLPENSKVKDNSAKKVEKTVPKTKEVIVDSIAEKESAACLPKEEFKSKSIVKQSIENKSQIANEMSELSTKPKSTDDSEKSKSKGFKKDLDESSEVTKVCKVNEEIHGSKNLKKTADKTELVSELKKIDEKRTISTSDEKTVDQLKAEKTNISKSKLNDIEIKEIPVRNSNASTVVLQPQRILRRRCTMIAYGSAPEVDKEKIHSANALLFEDLQEREKMKRKTEEMERQALRKSKHLADIFQKTDDTCTVSTQNIIIGKRRTRTTVNFNEVQQAQAVFKHISYAKKDAKETKNDNTNEIVMQTTEKCINETAAESKKLPPNRRSIKAIKAKAEKEDQSCTVSSTTSLTDETATFSGNVSASARKTKISAKAAQTEGILDNEPSSSAKSTNPTPTPLDEDNQELLEGFMKDMVKPNANTKFVLNLLSQILKPKQLQQVKKIVESAAKVRCKKAAAEQIKDESGEDDNDEEEEEEHESDTPETSQELNTDENKEKDAKEQIAATTKPTENTKKIFKKKRTNELDRLNEDIRDMFISQGVITATGRRMCTLAAAAEAGIKTEANIGDANNRKRDEKIVSKNVKPEAKDSDDVGVSPPRIRKTKVVISPINLNIVRRSMRVKGTDNVEDNNKTINDEKTSNETEVDSQILNQQSPERKMPVLKPNTPIKLSDEEQLEEIEEKLKTKSVKKRKVEQPKLAGKVKPCPKSKKIQLNDNAASEDSEEDIQLSSLRKRLKSFSKNSDEDDPDEENVDNNDNDDLRSNKAEQKAIIANTNSHWHSQSKYAQWCIICDAKFQHVALHYKVQHNNTEYYSSRIAPNILQQYKQGKLSTPIFGTCRPKQKNQVFWFYRCPFCLQHNRNVIRSWVDHFSKHTGEYLFECSTCHKAGNAPALIEKHIETKQCVGALVIRHQYPINQKIIKAHICHLCNYLQLYRINLERHYIEQHKCDPDRVTVLGYSINLINTDGAEVVDGKKAAEMEAAAIEKYTQDSLVIVDDDDDEVDHNLPISNVEKKNVDIEALKTSDALVEQEKNEQIKATENSNEVLSKKSCKSLETANPGINITPPKVNQELKDVDNKKSVVEVVNVEVKNKEINTKEKNNKPSNDNSESSQQQPIDDLEKMIVDVQEEVLAYAAKAEAEEKAREDALRSNIFTTSTRNNTDSPTIDCLTQSLRTIEQEEQLQQQKTYSAQKAQKQLQQSNTAEQKTHVMSIAERLSQRFKDIQVRSITSETVTATKDIEQMAANSSSVNSSFSETASTSGNNLVIAEENENSIDHAVHDGNTNMPDQDLNSGEDDGDWEDIEISESAPSANTSSISAGSSCASGASKEKQKKKKIYQSLTRLYSTMAATNKKGNFKTKKNTNFVNISSTSGKKQRGFPERPQQASNDNSAQPTEFVEKPRTLIHNLADLLPDSPCNDPMELVPELAPVEPLQDLNDISALLEANFNSVDAQNILQQLDMVPVTANSICISVDGQQQSIQDALDFVTEQQQGQTVSLIDLRHINEATIINSNPLQVINRIQNLGYSKTLDLGSYSTKFYCLSKNCSFIYSNESIGLENHYLSEHPQIKWNGFCNMCKQHVVSQVDGSNTSEALSITQEVRHMLEQHVEVAMEDSKEAENQEEENSTTDENENKPRIKLRRLTGDCLSSTTPTLINAPELRNSPTPPKDIINMTLTDLLNAEPRPLNLKTRPEIKFIPINKIINSSPKVEESESANATAKPVALFTNIGKDFTITSVSSANTEISTCTGPLQIANVVSLVDSSDITNAIENDCNVSMSALPKISNVCSLNSRAAGQKSNVFNSASLWQKQIETDRVELQRAAEESLEVSRILQSGRCRSPPTDKLGELLSKTLREDSPTVVAETLPTSTATSGDFLITQTVSAQYVDNNEISSAEPQLGFNISIAPTSSILSGSSSPILPDTQTTAVSDSELPARSQFRCMGTRCTYQTRVVVAMMEHLRFHERRNFSTERQYLRCSLCTNFADSIENYFEHAKDLHSQQLGIGTSNTNVSGSDITTCALTQKIQYILQGNNANRTSASNEFIDGITGESGSSRATAPSVELPYKQQLEQTIKEMVASTGLPESKVFRCPIKGCTTSLCETSFHKHLIYHLTTLGIINVNNYTYKCPHCVAIYHRPTGIKAHIKSHARHNVFCYMCMATASSSSHILKHFCEKHWKIPNVVTVPLLVLPNTEKDQNQNIYLLANHQQIAPAEVQQFGEKLISDWQRKKAASKTHFGCNEINLLPIQPIFQNEVHCAECNYKTKVRTNMFRHLQMHKTSSATSGSGGAQLHVASVDPVNPVPCLNSNERHFDKMCNLASSSLVTGNSSSGGSSSSSGVVVKPPFKLTYVHISESRRFTCGVPDCQYLTVSDEIFRSHLSALHSNLQQYQCPFCKEEISTRSLAIERIMQHLRYHSQKLYQCEECDYLHYMKNVVERHIHEKHPTQRVNLITHDRKLENIADGTRTMQLIAGKKFKDQFATRAATAADIPTNSLQSTGNVTTANTSAATNAKNKWECDICKHRTITYNQMISHANAQHACKQQYQCVHCQFGATQLAHIMTHIDEKHPTKTREARYVFHKINATAQEKEADTRPLWQRDDPKRVRHIRGILMENEEESEQYRKLLCLDGELDEDYDGLEIGDSTATTSTSPNPSNESILRIFDYACYHCDYKSSSFTELKYKHWQIVHNTIARDAKPFYFRLLISLKCGECRQYNGDNNELQVHLQNVHKTLSYIAADGYSQQFECGYCNFKYARTEQLVQHYRYANHQPQDLKTFTNVHLSAIKFLGISQTYTQCTICNELFANRMAIVAHEHSRHKNDANFSFKEIKNTIIYRCATCPFTSVDEMTTLRHMIDHYGQFKRCYFCYDSQSTFSSYMQHCYSEHREEVKSFSEIYTAKDITKYLLQILLIFPNGLIINKKNLAATKYGRDNCIREIYKEICKTSQQPPIPRLSIASLVARKSIEAKNFSSRNNSPNPDNELQSDFTSTAAALQLPAVPQQAKKIAKRRQTVAFGSNECESNALLLKDSVKTFYKKRKISESTPSSMPPPLSTNTEAAVQIQHQRSAQIEPYSFYGQTVEPLDLSKIYTKVAIGGLDTQLTIDNFKLLFSIDAHVVVEKLNLNQNQNQDTSNISYDNSNEYRHIKKACPASLKHKYV